MAKLTGYTQGHIFSVSVYVNYPTSAKSVEMEGGGRARSCRIATGLPLGDGKVLGRDGGEGCTKL